MKAPTSGILETETTQAGTDGRTYKSLDREVTPTVAQSSSGTTLDIPTANLIVHGTVARAITIPYNSDKEHIRAANRLANAPSVRSTETTATVELATNVVAVKAEG